MPTVSLSDKILSFLFNLQFDVPLPEGFKVLHPFKDKETRRVCTRFYNTYYNDSTSRFCIVGINPGRFGAGVTGVPFTDPIRLETALAIENGWPKKQELSSVFIYDMIEAFGGVDNFYSTFYITAVSPLGLVKDGKNINYYDNKVLQEAIRPFAVNKLNEQIAWGLRTEAAFCLGEGKNYEYLKKLNEQFGFFKTIIPLPHPRFIMQYKLKQKQNYIDRYLSLFETVLK